MKVNIHSSKPNYNYTFATATTGIIGVYGISGSGKSSLLNGIAGYQADVKGTIELQGKTISGVIKCSYMTQDSLLFPHWTVQQNLDFTLKYTNNMINHDHIDQLQLRDVLEKLPAQLSGGEKQRVAYVRALLQIEANSIVLLDEPFSALDAKLRTTALDLLKEQSNCLVFFVTHKISELYKIADELLYIKDGTVALHETIDTAMSSGYENLPIASKIKINGRYEIIYADDVSISLEKNSNSSIINQIAVTISAIQNNGNTAILELTIDASNKLFAQITLNSLNNLALKTNQQVIANFKALAYHH